MCVILYLPSTSTHLKTNSFSGSLDRDQMRVAQGQCFSVGNKGAPAPEAFGSHSSETYWIRHTGGGTWKSVFSEASSCNSKVQFCKSLLLSLNHCLSTLAEHFDYLWGLT
jgi:hypothetical protein